MSDEIKTAEEVQEQPKRRGRKPKAEVAVPETPVAETTAETPADPIAYADVDVQPEVVDKEVVEVSVDAVETYAPVETENDTVEPSTEPVPDNLSVPSDDELAAEHTGTDKTCEVPAIVGNSAEKVSYTLKTARTLYRSPSTNVPFTSVSGLIRIESGIPQNGFIRVSAIVAGKGRVYGWIQAD